MSLAQQLRAKLKRDAEKAAEKAAKRRAARIAKKVARTESDGLADLPLEVAVAMEQSPAEEQGKPAPVQSDDSVENLVARLTAIRERIWRLQAVFAVSLSHDVALEANQFLSLFQSLAAQLKEKDASKLEDLVRGHESLLESPPIPMKPTIPVDLQRFCEIRWEAMQSPARRPATPQPEGYVADGLQSWI